MHPGLIILDCDGVLVDSKPGADMVRVEVTAA
jgi:beta-phosphoglucomutase-like phosphatase (HAD superfamily)